MLRLLAISLLLCSCSYNKITHNHDLVLFSDEFEEQIGRQTKVSSIQSNNVLKNKELQLYIKNLTQQITNEHNKDIESLVLKNDAINAFATPGYFFINSGILPILYDEGALMGIMAHEIAHIDARHSVRKLSKKRLVDILLYGLFINFKHDDVEDLKDLLNKKFSRDYEYEADEFGVKALQAINKPAENLIYALQAFQALEDIHEKEAILNKRGKSNKIHQSQSNWKDTHPSDEKRIKKISELTEKWVEELKPYNQKEFYTKLDGLKFNSLSGSNEDNSAIRKYFLPKDNMLGFARPSSFGYKNTLYLKKNKLKINLPKNYQAKIHKQQDYGKNVENQIFMDIKYINDDLKALPKDLVTNFHNLSKNKKHKTFKIIDSKKNIFSYYKKPFFAKNGPFYTHLILDLNKYDNKGEIIGYQSSYIMVTLVSEYKKSFDEHMLNDIKYISNNIQTLTKKQASALKPLTIKTVQAKGDENFTEYAEKYTPYTNFSKDWFKLFNGMFNDSEQIKPNQWLKLIINNNENI